jgi:hypothetical protein
MKLNELAELLLEKFFREHPELGIYDPDDSCGCRGGDLMPCENDDLPLCHIGCRLGNNTVNPLNEAMFDAQIREMLK